MELPTWWLKFEDECSSFVMVTLGFSLALGWAFLFTSVLYDGVTAWKEEPSTTNFFTFWLIGFSFLVGYYFQYVCSRMFDMVTNLTQCLIKTVLRLTILLPLLVVGLVIQIVCEAVYGPWKEPVIRSENSQ